MDELVKAELNRIDDENRRQNQRLNKIEERIENIGDLVAEIRELSVNMQHMLEDQKSMKSDLEVIKSASGKKWDGLVWLVITLIVGALIGYVLTRVGL